MASGGKVEVETLNKALIAARISEGKEANNGGDNAGGCAQVNCYTKVINDVTLHFQIIRLPRQIYVWIGYNSAKFGNLYAAAPSPPIKEVSVSCVLGGAFDNTGSGIAQQLVLKTGLHAVLASNVPKNLPLIEAEAKKMLMQKLIQLGYTKPRLGASSS